MSNIDQQAQNARERELTDRVAASFAQTADDRLRELMVGLTEHLHAFVRELRPTEHEWEQAIDFLTAVGHITDERRQEFILLSDVFGVSMQTVTINNQAIGDATEATVFGPFFVDDAPQVCLGGDISGGAPGEPCWVEGRVTDVYGHPVAGARIEVWEADEDGLYDVQYTDNRVTGRGHLHTDATGHYRFWGLTPTPYPIPDDGPVGALLQSTGRSPLRASHMHFMVSAPAMRTLITHIFVRGDELLDRDSVFGVRESLVVDFEQQSTHTPTPDGRDLRGTTWSRAQFDIVLAPEPLEEEK